MIVNPYCLFQSITPTAFIDLDDSIDDRSMSTGNNNLNLGDAVEIDDSDTDLADITDDGCLMEVKIRWKSRNVERLELGKVLMICLAWNEKKKKKHDNYNK